LVGSSSAEQSAADLRTLADLKGRRIAIAGKHFLGTYMAPAVELQRAGVDISTLTWVETTQPVDQVITSVLAGKADAGFVRTGVLEDLVTEGKLNPTELTIVNPLQHPGYAFVSSTRLYPEWPFLTVAHVDREVSRRVSAALFSLQPTAPSSHDRRNLWLHHTCGLRCRGTRHAGASHAPLRQGTAF
jgi:ABC-type phosphate/phosphonate transport system substrate-binding protein